MAEQIAQQQSEVSRLKDTLKQLESERQDELSRIQDLEEQLQQQSEEMEETDDRCRFMSKTRRALLRSTTNIDLAALKDIKRLQESHEKLQVRIAPSAEDASAKIESQVRCETLQREVKALQDFKSSTIQQHPPKSSTSNKAEATPLRAGPLPTPQSVSAQSLKQLSASKKRSMPEDFENAPAPVRAIAVSTTSPSTQRPASARPVASFKPRMQSKLGEKSAIESKLGKRPAPLGSVRQPLKDEGANSKITSSGAGGSQSSKLRASLAALQQPK